MTYIKTQIEEGHLLNDIAELLEEGGWEIAKYFKKTVFPSSYINPNQSESPQDEREFSVAEHMIMKHPCKDLYYGFALYGEFKTKLGFMPKEAHPKFSIVKKEDPNLEHVTFYESENDFEDLADWATNLYPNFKETHTLYVYMARRIPENVEHNGDVVFPYDKSGMTAKGAALDIEAQSSRWVILNASPNYQIHKAEDQCMQSPVSAARLRIPSRERVDDTWSAAFPQQFGNWHGDSKIDVEGEVNDRYVFITLHADASASYEGNGVPKIPLFIGEFIPENLTDEDNYALATGSAFKKDDPDFDFDNPEAMTPKKEIIQPVLKNWENDPSDGVDSIMVYRGKKGSYYQSHYLSVDAPPNRMPPKREYNGKGYPQAWNRPESDVYRYRHNPSVYSKKITSSVMYIVHGDEGPRGRLPDAVSVVPFNILDGDKLKERVAHCLDGDKELEVEYTYQMIQGVSPWTKIPGTPYRQLGIGIMSKDIDVESTFPIYQSPLDDLILSMWNSDEEDGDKVTLKLNGLVIAEEKELFNKPLKLRLNLKSGVNILEFVGISAGSAGDLTASLALGDEDGNLLTDEELTLEIPRTNVDSQGNYQGKKPTRQWVIKR